MMRLMGITVLGVLVIFLIVTPIVAQEATPTPTPAATATPTPTATPAATPTPTGAPNPRVPVMNSWGLSAFLLTIASVAIFLLRRRG